MSRIAGIVSGAGGLAPARLIERMLGASRSNGNWSSRIEASSQWALGWTGWRSPNVARLDDVVVVMDGVVYNREGLARAETDAELLALAYRCGGFADALRCLNGDFAVALYDLRAGTLWLGRDRFGVKPLYYVARGDTVAFASRPRALLSLPDVPADVDRRFVGLFAASHYRVFDNDPERSPYASIAQVPAAHALRCSNGALAKSAYWSLEDTPDFTEPEGVLAERYRELLLDAVSARVRTAGRRAFTLSGGVDSSSVLACAVRSVGARQHAFSAVYEDATYDESDAIRSVLAMTVEEWHQVKVGNPDVVALVERMIAVHDEPVATATWLAHYLLAREARELGFESLFGGLGGDELNAGEYEYFLFFFADLRAAGRRADLDREVALWIAHHDHPVFRKSVETVRDGLARCVDGSRPGRCLPDATRLRRYMAALNPEYFDLAAFEPVMEHRFASYLKNRAWQDLTRETLPCCLRAEDRQATAFELDHVLPFLDHRLVEFMFRVPGTLKIRDGVTKHLLREATRGILPEATRTRVKKTGWNAPAHVWFAGPGRDMLLDLVASRAFRERGVYNATVVRRLIDEHDEIVSSGRLEENHMMFLWQLVNLELWLRSVAKL